MRWVLAPCGHMLGKVSCIGPPCEPTKSGQEPDLNSGRRRVHQRGEIDDAQGDLFEFW